MIGIYKITNKINGKSYIGQSNNINRRIKEHFSNKLCHNQSLARAIRKYGKENFEIEILEEIDELNRDMLNVLEIKYIDIHKPKYNRTLGGAGNKGMIVSDKTKKRLSEKGKQQWNNYSEDQKAIVVSRLVGPPIGHPVSDETKEKLRKANLGKKQSEETIQKRKTNQQITWNKKGGKDATSHYKKVKIVELDLEFESVKSCAEFLGCQSSHLCNVIRHKRGRKTVKKYHIVYVV